MQDNMLLANNSNFLCSFVEKRFIELKSAMFYVLSTIYHLFLFQDSKSEIVIEVDLTFLFLLTVPFR